MLYDHVDLRVKDLEAARSFYGAWLPALGLVELEGDEGSVTYGSSTGGDVPFLSVIEDRQQRPDRTRLAFRARTRAELDEAARLVRVAGALDMEDPALCPEYGPSYYAAFFADPSGNLLEICHR